MSAPASTILSVADAVVGALNAGTFSQAFTAVRLYRPLFSPADLDTLHVTVVPRGMRTELLGRNQVLNEAAIDVAVQKHVPPGDTQQATLDSLMGLVNDIETAFQFQRLATTPSAMWVRSEYAPIYSFEHLDVQHIFTSVLTLTFKVGG